MAFDRKVEAVLTLKPDIAIICECASPDRLRRRSSADWMECEPIWIGTNQNKGLGVFAFNGFSVRLAESYAPALRYIAPVRVSGPIDFNLLAVWAQNASGGVTRKYQSGPLRRALTKYRDFLAERSSVVGGDLNSNAIWDKPGWRINHMAKVRVLRKLGLVSAYHGLRNEAHGNETQPTIYWRDRTQHGPTYHIDYIFVPIDWLNDVREFNVGSFQEWVGSGLSDHVPLILDVRF